MQYCDPFRLLQKRTESNTTQKSLHISFTQSSPPNRQMPQPNKSIHKKHKKSSRPKKEKKGTQSQVSARDASPAISPPDGRDADDTPLNRHLMCTTCATAATTPAMQDLCVEDSYENYHVLIDRWIHTYGLRTDTILSRLMQSKEELDRLFRSGEISDRGKSYAEALEFMRNDLRWAIMQRFGVEQFDAIAGQPLDENIQIAVAKTCDKSVANGVIVTPVKPGWIDKQGFVMRLAEVVQNLVRGDEDYKSDCDADSCECKRDDIDSTVATSQDECSVEFAEVVQNLVRGDEGYKSDCDAYSCECKRDVTDSTAATSQDECSVELKFSVRTDNDWESFATAQADISCRSK
jgi:molecular chaperone GrpE (heat shock protein)